jgi:hypothetical protein
MHAPESDESQSQDSVEIHQGGACTSHALGARGWCEACQKHHALGFEGALPYAHWMQKQLQQRQSIDFAWPPKLDAKESPREVQDLDPRWSTDWLYHHIGQMFGVLVCEDASGQEVLLRAFSYQHKGQWHAKDWVDPVFDTLAYDAEIERGNGFLHPLTAEIEALCQERELRGWAPQGRGASPFVDASEGERQERLALDGRIAQLKQERKAHSRDVMARMHGHYHLQNFRGEVRDLAGAWIGKTGIPMGTGDCCAPKLLVAAARRGLKPIAMAEFYWGKGTLDGLRKEGEFFGACERRCQPIMGFLLCGGVE